MCWMYIWHYHLLRRFLWLVSTLIVCATWLADTLGWLSLRRCGSRGLRSWERGTRVTDTCSLSRDWSSCECQHYSSEKSHIERFSLEANLFFSSNRIESKMAKWRFFFWGAVLFAEYCRCYMGTTSVLWSGKFGECCILDKHFFFYIRLLRKFRVLLCNVNFQEKRTVKFSDTHLVSFHLGCVPLTTLENSRTLKKWKWFHGSS